MATKKVEAPKAAPVVEKKVEAPKAAAKKVEAPKAAAKKVEAPKAAAKKTEAPKATAAKKAPAKKVAAKKPAKKEIKIADAKVEIQAANGQGVAYADIIKKVNKKLAKEMTENVKTLAVYVKAEDGKAYIVANGNDCGSVDLF